MPREVADIKKVCSREALSLRSLFRWGEVRNESTDMLGCVLVHRDLPSEGRLLYVLFTKLGFCEEIGYSMRWKTNDWDPNSLQPRGSRRTRRSATSSSRSAARRTSTLWFSRTPTRPRSSSRACRPVRSLAPTPSPPRTDFEEAPRAKEPQQN